MSRWVDADALIEKLKQHHNFFVKAWGGFKEMPLTDKIRCDELSNSIAEICNAPSIDLVRCRECRYVGTDATSYLVCDREGIGLKPFHVYPDDFCSYGERRTDE